jgi:hypothetical protein
MVSLWFRHSDACGAFVEVVRVEERGNVNSNTKICFIIMGMWGYIFSL